MKTTMQNQTNNARTLEPNEKHRVGKGNSNEERRSSLGRISFERRRANRALATWELIDLVQREAPELYNLAQVVGTWVWISFQERQPSLVTTVLAELGFYWNKRRQVWQHPCGSLRTAERRDPREKYATYSAADRQTNESAG